MMTQWLDYQTDGLENEINSVDILLLHFPLGLVTPCWVILLPVKINLQLTQDPGACQL